MKRFLKVTGILAALAALFLVASLGFPIPMARAAIALSNEVSVERTFIPNPGDAPRAAPLPISLRGANLSRVKRELKITNGKSFTCFCKGDFRLQFKLFGLTLASFRGHLRETPARIVSSQPLDLEPKGAHRLAAFFRQIAPR